MIWLLFGQYWGNGENWATFSPLTGHIGGRFEHNSRGQNVTQRQRLADLTTTRSKTKNFFPKIIIGSTLEAISV